jgi:hypothetical protein
MGTEQARWSEAEELRIDQNQCGRLKDNYVFDHRNGGEPAVQAYCSRQRAEETL